MSHKIHVNLLFLISNTPGFNYLYLESFPEMQAWLVRVKKGLWSSFRSIKGHFIMAVKASLMKAGVWSSMRHSVTGFIKTSHTVSARWEAPNAKWYFEGRHIWSGQTVNMYASVDIVAGVKFTSLAYFLIWGTHTPHNLFIYFHFEWRRY